MGIAVVMALVVSAMWGWVKARGERLGQGFIADTAQPRSSPRAGVRVYGISPN